MSIGSTEDYTDHGGMDLRPSQYAGVVDRVFGTHLLVLQLMTVTTGTVSRNDGCRARKCCTGSVVPPITRRGVNTSRDLTTVGYSRIISPPYRVRVSALCELCLYRFGT